MLSLCTYNSPFPSIESSPTDIIPSGLGIGTTPAALMAHGIWTTIVEIDPVVHDFATKYFRLPETHTEVIDDAVSYASLVAGGFDYNGHVGRKFDYIVHDVFTGGAEPVELFTLEFLQDLRTMLNPNGVIAIVSHVPYIQQRCLNEGKKPPMIKTNAATPKTELRRRFHAATSANNREHHSRRLPQLQDVPRERAPVSHGAGEGGP